MSIKPTSIAVPQPSTHRGQSSHISYDAKHERLAYTNGKSIIVRPVDFNATEPVIVFSKHLHPTTAVKFSPSGFYIASGDESGQVKIWDVSPKDELTFEQPVVKSEFPIISGPIKSIAWDNDSQRIIAVGQGKEKFGHAFSWDSGNSIGDIQGHSSTINAVDIKSQRPYRAATVGDDFAMVFFNGPPFKFDKSSRGNHTNVVKDVKFSPDGEFLVSGGSDKSICLYQGKTGEFIKKIDKAHLGGIFAIAWTPDSKHFYTSSADNSLKKWTPEGECVQTIQVNDKPHPSTQQNGFALTKDYVVSLSTNGSLNYFNYDGSLQKVISGHQTSVTKIELNGSHLLSGSSDGKLYEWTLKDGKLSPYPILKGSDQDQHSNYIADINSNDEFTFTIGWDDILRVWKGDKVVNEVKLSKQPKQIIPLSNSKIIVLFEDEIQVFSSDLKRVSQVELKFSTSNGALLDDSTLLITNSSNNTIEEYKISSDRIEKSRQFPKMRAPPTLIKVSPDGENFAVGDSAGKYTLYKSSDASVVTTRWAFHTSKIFDAKWSKDSKFLISGGLDGALFLYSVEKPSKVLKFPLAHSGSGISGIEWVNYDENSHTGTFFTSGLDGTIRTWEILE